MTRTKPIATIDPEAKGVTLINIYEVAPDNQTKLVKLLSEGTDNVMGTLAGFISASIHQSLDGTRVANYAQWASKEDFDRMLQNPAAQARMKQFAALAKNVSPVLYRVSSVHTG
ncbi:MAG: antibiotic biosynthesis monooxygenase family protein [Bacteroidota bacterium]